MANYKVGVLGATGAVGQKFITLLTGHPWFKVTAVAASARSAGKTYREAANWIESGDIPADIAGLIVQEAKPEFLGEVDFVFSGMDSAVAGDIEMEFAKAGIPVITNARNYRRHENVPLLVPEVNPGHTKLINTQKFSESGNGFIVTNPNCVCVPLVLSLKPLHDAFGLKSIVLTSMQAVSGAG